MGPYIIPFVITLVLINNLIKNFCLRTCRDVKPDKFSEVFDSARILGEHEHS